MCLDIESLDKPLVTNKQRNNANTLNYMGVQAEKNGEMSWRLGKHPIM